MGYAVIAFCNIEAAAGIKKGVMNRIASIAKKHLATNVKTGKDFITFELSGNKWVDYQPLDRIKELLLKQKVSFEINASEFVECQDGGYYFDSEDEE
jgi:hypothetical protein